MAYDKSNGFVVVVVGFDYDAYETAECHDNSTDMKPLLIMRNISIQFNSKID